MKKLVSATFLILLVYSCKKETGPKPETDIYLHSVLSHLRDSLSIETFSLLDTNKAYLTDPGKAKYYTLRLPFMGKPIAEDFMLLRSDGNGNILQGQIVHLETGGVSEASFSGKIQLNSLSGQVLLMSTVSNGFIDALHPASRTGRQVKDIDSKTVTLLPAPDADWLPEVVVVGYGSSSPPTSYISLDGLLGTSSAGILAGGGGDGSGGGGAPSGGGGSGNANNSAENTPPIYSPVDPGTSPVIFSHGAGLGVTSGLELEKEYVNSIPTVDIRKFFNCFDLVPSAGASYTIQLCADVPSNNNPDVSMNFSGTVNAGHSFLVITKSGNGVTVTQSFGYYPQTAPSAWNPFSPIPSAIKDNKGQEINASITMSIGPDQFNAIRSTAINQSAQPYILDKSNCTDFALSVFNAGRSTPLTMDPYILRQAGIAVSNGITSPPITVTINNSPQKLYAKLATMKTNGNAEAGNIQLDLSHNLKAPISHGECN
ncbi:MAG TPA: hypothetical protein VGN00_12855 [Puia sp.]|jgi:hypothetical protein